MKKQAQTLDTNNCPVPDDMLGRLYRSPEAGIVQTVSTLPAIQRARLAIFCYGRAHLSDMGLAIASTCDRDTLVEIAHRVGEALYEQSRERPKQPVERATPGRRNITLASSASWGDAPRRPLVDDALDDEAPESLHGEMLAPMTQETSDDDAAQERMMEPALAVGY